jgi:CHAT domain-containing protein
MSFWSVAESASIRLVESFFNNLKSGKNKLEALRLARGGIREEGYAHPSFWASFVLVGEVD